MVTLKAVRATFLKTKPIDSSLLEDPEIIKVVSKQSFECSILGNNKNHILIQLPEKQKGFFNWHAWAPDWTATGDVQLGVKFEPQTNNLREPDRECYSSSSYMVINFVKPGVLKSDDDYVGQLNALGYDTTDAAGHQVLWNKLGVKSMFRTDLGFEDLEKQLYSGRPVAIGFLHRGSLAYPTGGHWAVVIGRKGQDFILHDPYGSLTDGYKGPVENGKAVIYTRRELGIRWRVGGSGGWGRIISTVT